MPRATSPDGDALELAFSGPIWYWRGPPPFLFVTVLEEGSAAIRAIASAVTYGWGVIPVTVRLGDTVWQTSLFPKDGRYLVPIKVLVLAGRRAGVDEVALSMGLLHRALLPIAGIPMLERVVDAIAQSEIASSVTVSSDDPRLVHSTPIIQ